MEPKPRTSCWVSQNPNSTAELYTNLYVSIIDDVEFSQSSCSLDFTHAAHRDDIIRRVSRGNHSSAITKSADYQNERTSSIASSGNAHGGCSDVLLTHDPNGDAERVGSSQCADERLD